MKVALAAALALLCSMPLMARERASGYCEQGGHVVVTQGLNSDTDVQQSFPSCTVTVYDNGTTTLSSLYSDNNGTVKSNPFTSDANGYWFFYANNGRYDVHFSNSVITAPYTQGDYLLCDPLETNGAFTCTGNSAPACSTTIQGSLSISPQTCAGEKTLQGIVGNPNDVNFEVVPPSDLNTQNLYFGPPSSSFSAGEAQDNMAISANVGAVLNMGLKGPAGFTNGFIFVNQDNNPANINGEPYYTGVVGSMHIADQTGGSTIGSNFGSDHFCIMDAGTALECDGLGVAVLLKGGTLTEESAGILVASPTGSGTSNPRNVGIHISNQHTTAAKNFALLYDSNGLSTPTFVDDGGHLVATEVGTLQLQAATANTLCYSSQTVEGYTGIDVLATCSSLRRFKKNIRSLHPNSSLSEVMKLRPVSYTSKTDGRREIHFIAEEVQAVDPRLSTYKPDGSLIGVSDGGMVALLMSAAQQQQKEIEELKKQIEDLVEKARR